MLKLGVVGGGISGLTLTHRLSKLLTNYGKPYKIYVIEKSNRLGGWIKSKRLDEEIVWEGGPRSLRIAGVPGLTTLKLIQELNLSSKIIAVPKSAPAARNRYLYSNDQFHLLPRSLTKMVFNPPPILSGIARELVREPFQTKSPLADESVEQFLTRRLGPIVGSTLGSAMVRGIYSGDSRMLSMRAAFGGIWKWEQDFGSITKGILNDMVSPSKANRDYDQIQTMKQDILTNDPAADHILTSSMIGFDGGIETLSSALTDQLRQNPNIEFIMNSECQAIQSSQVANKNIRIKYASITKPLPQFKDVDHAFLAAPSHQLSSAIDSKLIELPDTPWSNVTVINVSYRRRPDGEKVIPFDGFGYLVPRSQPSVAIGVVFDSCAFPELHNHYKTLTVMVGKDQMQGRTKDELITLSLQCLKDQLNINRDPDLMDVNLNHSCIPLYPVGHCDAMKGLKAQLEKSKHLSLIGNSYSGVSVNDCITNGDVTATNYFNGAILKNSNTSFTGLEKFD